MSPSGGIHILWSEPQRNSHDAGPVNPQDIFPETSAGSLPSESDEPPIASWSGYRPTASGSRSYSGTGISRAARASASGRARAWATTPSTGGRGPAAACSRPMSALAAPRPPSYSPVPALNLQGRAGSPANTSGHMRQHKGFTHNDMLKVAVERSVSNRTVSRINGVARYRKYKALSESLTRKVPAEMSINRVTKSIEESLASTAAELPEKLPYKLDGTMTIQEEHVRYTKKAAAKQVDEIKPEPARCSLFFSRARSYSAPGVPGTQQTPRPGVARLQRTVKSGYINEFILPRQPRGYVYVRNSPRESQHSPREYRKRLAATATSGSGLPSQAVIGEMDPKLTPKDKSTVIYKINGVAVPVDLYGGMHPTAFRNEVRAKAQAWIEETEKKYKHKCRLKFDERVERAEKELIKYHNAEEEGVIIKDQIRKKCHAMAVQQIAKDQLLEMEWLRVEEWNLTKVGNYFQEEYKKELQHAQAMQLYEEMVANNPRRRLRRNLSGRMSSEASELHHKGEAAAANLQQKLRLTTEMQQRMEAAKGELDEREAEAASHLAKIAEMQAKEKEKSTAEKLANWTQKAARRAAAKAKTEQEIREELAEAAHKEYVKACHKNKALECHYLKPMLSTHKIAMHDDLLFPNHIMAIGICLRALPHVRVLELKSCGMDDTALNTLLNEIRGLELSELRLQQNLFSPLGCEAIAEVLMPRSSPQEAAVDNASASVAEMVNQPPSQLYETLEVLSLQDNPVGDQGLYALTAVLSCSNSRLRRLNLSRTNLTDTSAPALEQVLGNASCLESLDLSWNKLSIQSGKAIGNGLFRAKSLTSLHLGWNNLHNEGTEALAEALRFNPDCPLLTLNLSAARMQSPGYLALANMVKHNPQLKLRRLVLNFSLMDNVGAQCLMRVMKGMGRQRLRLEMENCTLKPGEPPEILKETLGHHSDDDSDTESTSDHPMSPTRKRLKEVKEYLSSFHLDLSQPKDRCYARFLVEHEVDAYALNRAVWYNAAIDGKVLRKHGRATNAVDPFDVVRLGWAENLPQRGTLWLEVLLLPKNHIMAGLKIRAPREIPEDGSSTPAVSDCSSPLSSRLSSPNRPSSPVKIN